VKPTDVKLHRANGTVINCELVHDGPNEDGVDEWSIVGVVYRPGDHISVGILPARTGITIAARP